ncbi:sigma 54-interacting transcriptional regulator [candidate division KSB1 bacterium]|nr:sigma 54-interacting transcriptional regulator [candidate division KSB1 bacterium]
MSQSIVECIIQDSCGFMWFCTEDGLNKYDGYNFTVLRTNPENPSSLSQNHTTCILEAKDGIFWIGTFNGGLNRYDPKTEAIKSYRAESNNPNALCDDIITDIIEDQDGTLWIATANGFSQFHPETEKFTCYFHNPHNPRTLSHNSVRSLSKDNLGNIWLATDYGLNKFDKETRQFTNYYHDPHNDNSLGYDKVRRVYADRNSVIWIGTDGGGLDKLTFTAEGHPQFKHFRHDPDNPNSLSHNSIYSLYKDSFGTLWIGTNGGGLNLYDTETQTFSHYRNTPLDPYSINYDEIYDIYEDNTGVIWLGTYGGGVNKINQVKQQFLHYKSNPTNPNSLNHDIVWSILEDEDGILWLGTHGGGLNRYDRVRNEWTHYRHDPENPNSISHDVVRVVFKDRQGIMWLATHGGGLNRFDPNSGHFKSYRHDPADPNSISHDELRCIFQDSQGTLWIGTYGGGLDKFNRQSDCFQHFQHDPINPNSISTNYIRAIHEDKSGILWIGTQGGGLNHFDPRTGNFTHFRNDPQDSTSLSNDFIFAIIENSDASFWLGTYGGGLNKFDPVTGTCERFTEADGLASNSIYGFVKDDQGMLWISTNNGISKFNPFNQTFTNYNVDDGLQSTEFNGGSFFKSKSGEIFFGGINGFNAFYPENIHGNENKPPIVITDFRVFNEPFDLKTPISDIDEIKLSWKDNVFSFEFAALDFTAPKRNRYAHKMDGLDKEWIYTDASKRFANYTTLPPGKYTFRVKGSNNDDVWNEEGASIKIVITPPFWQTPVFRSLVFIIALLLLFIAYKWFMKTIRQKRAELEERIRERTEAANTLQAALNEVEILKNRLQAENIYLQDEIKLVTNFENIITKSDVLKSVLQKVEQVAETDATVLILGESGTGKELIARAIHNISERCERILVKVNCSALPATLIESELFGHEKGAFTGAIARKIGRFELANGGTIFLDEIGDLPLELQAKLLRVLQEGEFERLGGTETTKVDVRVIAATNRELQKEIRQGNFREDLYFRLNVFPLYIPPLRNRKEDIPLLAHHFIKKYSAKTGKKIATVPQRVMDALVQYHWPGNVRELENIIERAVITSRDKTLKIGDWLPQSESVQSVPGFVSLIENERQHIIKALSMTNWRVSGNRGAAKILGINPKTLESRMKKLNIVKND